MSQALDDDFLARMDQEFTGWSDPATYLRAALDNDELNLYYRPIRALGGARDFPMAEVLVRMRKEESSLLPPGEFLPVFEHYRMMPQLDRWVVRTGYAQGFGISRPHPIHSPGDAMATTTRALAL